MTLDQITYVIEISKAGSISKAAKNLLLTQPNLSTSIKCLEDELGFNIFKRQPRGVVLTQKGEEFLKHANSIYSNIKNINNLSDTHTNKALHSLKVISQFYSFILHEFLSVYSNHQNNNLDFSIKQTHYFDVLESVYNKSFDIGILTISDDMVDTWNKLFTYKNLTFTPLCKNHIRFYILEGHPLYNDDNITTDKLYNYPLITCSHDDIHFIYEKSHLFNNRKNFNKKIAVSDYAALIFTMNQVDGITMLSRFNDKDVRIFDDFNIKYKYIEIDNTPDMTCGWIKRDDKELSLIETEFLDELINFFDSI